VREACDTTHGVRTCMHACMRCVCVWRRSVLSACACVRERACDACRSTAIVRSQEWLDAATYRRLCERCAPPDEYP
jgi:hypothetical protein